MAENSQSSPMDDTLSTTITTSATHIDIENPYYLHSSDGTGTSLVGTPLVGIDNYTSWALAMTMALRGRNKFCFVDGTLAMPDVSHPDHTIWQRVNNIVMSWILNSIHPSLAHTVLHYPPPKCSCSARTTYVTQTERRRLFQFLMGLRETYSQARSQLLLNSVLPCVKGAYALLLQDEKQRTLDHLGTSTNVTALQAATQNSNMSANFQHDFHNLTGTSFTPPMPNNFQTPVIPQQATTQFASQQHPFHMLPNNSHANVATQPCFGNNRSKLRCTHCGILVTPNRFATSFMDILRVTSTSKKNANHEADPSPLCSSKTTLDQTTGKGNW
nr:UBN2_3 domain-containing protein [Ipomoea batatas]